VPATRSNDDRHSSQSGTLLALVKRLSQMRHPEGKNTLTRASLACANHPRIPCRFGADAALDELARAMPAKIYSFSLFN